MSNPQFTLRQAIAWIIWRAPDRSLRIDRPDVSDGDALRSWWDATADIERGVRAAAIDLAEKINAGTVVASGWRVSEGTPWHGVSGAEYVERIPAGTAQNLCQVPVEWIEAVAGAWLLIDSRIVNGLVAGERYCRVTVDADAVRAKWPDGNSTPPDQPSSPTTVTPAAPDPPIPASDTVDGTGAPGRPTKSMHLIEDEFDRRVKEQIANRALAQEAAELRAWLVSTHPQCPPPTIKTIENRLRDRHRQFRSDPPILSATA